MQKLKGILILLAGILLGKTRYDRHMCREMARLAIIGWFRPYRISYVACFVGEQPILNRQGIPTGEVMSGHMELIHQTDQIPACGMRVDLPLDRGYMLFEVVKVFYGRLIHDRQNWGHYDAIVILDPGVTASGRTTKGLRLLDQAKRAGWMVWWNKNSKNHPTPDTIQPQDLRLVSLESQ